jgi:hypothetical protein
VTAFTAEDAEVAERNAGLMARARKRSLLRYAGRLIAGSLPRSPVQGLALRMPGRSHEGALPSFTEEERGLARELRRDVEVLATEINQRNAFNPLLYKRAEEYIAGELEAAGYSVQRQTFEAMGVPCVNLDVELRGRSRPDEIVIVGAHYDAIRGSPAANDNGSGVAATLALARRFAGKARERTIRFVFFANEEPPFFWTELMGSLVYAKACRERRENIVAMFTPETIGYYSDEPGSQKYPIRIGGYPDRGNFIMFVGMYEARKLVRRCVGCFRERCAFPCHGAAVSSLVPYVGASDHWSFWRQGYPAFMVTDTAPLRYPYYHTPQDTPDKIDFEKTARVTLGLGAVLEDLAGGGRL